MDDDFVKFDKSMEAIDTVADPLPRSRDHGSCGIEFSGTGL
jgi:hypothetical protein